MTGVTRTFRLPGGSAHDPAIDRWMREQSTDLAAIARRWFDRMRSCGDDVRELMHDGHPTACVADAAFGYVAVFTSHINVGFFCGTELADPAHLLEGTGKYMRHVTLRPGRAVDESALATLVIGAYEATKARTRTV
jgi:hypothetical protein